MEEIYIEEAEEFFTQSETYRKVIKHRKKCKKWGKEFCIDCFGGGLTLFNKNLQKEVRNSSQP